MMTSTLPILDGHNDTLLHLYSPERGRGRSFFEQSEQGHIDLPRARQGNFAGGFFAIFCPAPGKAQTMKERMVVTETGYEVRPFPAIEHAYAQRMTGEVIELLYHLEAESAGQIKVVRTVDELQDCMQKGILAIILHFEGAEAIAPDLDNLESFYQKGLRSLGLVWSRPNDFAHGVPFGFPRSPDTGPGLTAAGRELVHACNRLGILVDLAHLNEQGFWDVAQISNAPLVVTHTAVHALCPSTRNLTDRQLDAVKASDGIVGLNFGVSDLRTDTNRDPNLPLTVMVRHIDYLVEHLGIDRVGFGSDFDGTTVSREIGDVSGLPKLVTALREHGYDEAALRKLTHENWLRVLRLTWA